PRPPGCRLRGGRPVRHGNAGLRDPGPCFTTPAPAHFSGASVGTVSRTRARSAPLLATAGGVSWRVACHTGVRCCLVYPRLVARDLYRTPQTGLLRGWHPGICGPGIVCPCHMGVSGSSCTAAGILRSAPHCRVRSVVLCRCTSQAMAAAGSGAVAPQFWPVWVIDHSTPLGGQDAPGPALYADPGGGIVWLRDLAVRDPATAVSAAGVCRL